MTGFLVHQLYGERYEEASRKAQGQGERASLWGAEIIQYGDHGTEQGKVERWKRRMVRPWTHIAFPQFFTSV